MKDLVRLKRDYSAGDASGSRDDVSWEGYLALSVICVMSLGGSVMETMILAWPVVVALSLAGVLFIHLEMLYTWFSCTAHYVRKPWSCRLNIYVGLSILVFSAFLLCWIVFSLWYLSVIVWWKSFGVTKATVESSFIWAVLSGCSLQIFQDWPHNKFMLFMLTTTQHRK